MNHNSPTPTLRDPLPVSAGQIEAKQAELHRQLLDSEEKLAKVQRMRAELDGMLEIGDADAGPNGKVDEFAFTKQFSSGIAVGGFRVRSMQPIRQDQRTSPVDDAGVSIDLFQRHHRQWLDFVETLANVPVRMELLFAIGKTAIDSHPTDSPTDVFFLTLGRSPDQQAATERCRERVTILRELLEQTLTDVSFEPIGKASLSALLALMDHDAVELTRRRIELPFAVDRTNPLPMSDNLGDGDHARLHSGAQPSWTPAVDSWSRLVSAFRRQRSPAALIVHATPSRQATASSRDAVTQSLANVESHLQVKSVDTEVDPPLTVPANCLRATHSQQLLRLHGNVLAARVFIASANSPSAPLVATVSSSLHRDSAGQNWLPGGVATDAVAGREIVASLATADGSHYYTPLEATAFLRTPIPISPQLGIPLSAARDLQLVGESGDDAPLGLHQRWGAAKVVCTDSDVRFEHTYVVGKTGTGKSTFLLQQILSDIGMGRGVGVLDPHGTLIRDVLNRMPAERANDVIVVDPADLSRPVGFNPLVIHETDPLRYRQTRDLVINDLYSDLEHAYAENWHLVSGPTCESHIRGVLGLLLGVDPPKSPWIPNLGLIRSVYANPQVRATLIARIRGRDQVTEDFIREAEAASGDVSIRNMSVYIASKFNRFVSDLSMRNLICQNHCLDLGKVVNDRKILLVNLGRGRFGEHAARLLASMVISRLRHAVMKRGSNHPPFYLFADECQLFADMRLAELLSEARKFGLSLTLAHQYLDQLPPKVLDAIVGNVATTVSFRVSPADAGRMAQLFAPTVSAEELIGLPNYRGFIRSRGSVGLSPFTINTQRAFDLINPRRGELISEMSRLRHGRDRREVEHEIARTHTRYTRWDTDASASSDPDGNAVTA